MRSDVFAGELSEVRDDRPRTTIDHLDACMEQALAARHFVLYRIADLRKYWVQVRGLGEPFEFAAFRPRQAALEYLEWHAWALRFAAQSRLWAARRLVTTGDVARTEALLRQNLESFRGRPGLEGSGDRATLARSYSGIAVLQGGAGGGDAWSRFRELGWASAWMAERHVASPDEIWSEVK